MNEQPVCSENELRWRSRQRFDCMAATGSWNSAVENSPELAADDRLHGESCFAELQHLQDVEPTAGIDEPDSQTNASNKRQLVLLSFICVNKNHTISTLLRQYGTSETKYGLRPRHYSLTLSVKISSITERYFVTRLLFKDVYWRLTIPTFILLYISIARSHLDYCSSVWAPYRKGDIEALEKVPKRATKILLGLKNLRLEKSCVKYDLWKFNFSNRVVNTWNSLPNWVVSANTTNMFKARLDKFWHNQDIIYNLRVQLQATGSHSECLYE